MTTSKNTGLYVHIPFCSSKCPYCDFYSFRADDETKEQYVRALRRELKMYSDVTFTSVYFGGGTPSQLRAEEIISVLELASCSDGCEITVECNPSDLAGDTSGDYVKILARGGVNRISMGMQSAVDRERKKLGRRAGKNEITKSLQMIEKAGIDNFSLDLMLGIPYQNEDSLKESIRFIRDSGAPHASAYLLAIEEGTPFEKVEKQLELPDEDRCCSLYLTACEELEKAGLVQYEISNFARTGFESRHNLTYWSCEDYVGIGAAAHSFYGGKRFYYPPDASDFISSAQTVSDGDGGSFEEYAMLRLRLTEGLKQADCIKRFGRPIGEDMINKALEYSRLGKMKVTDEGVSLTREGFLTSNTILAELL